MKMLAKKSQKAKGSCW